LIDKELKLNGKFNKSEIINLYKVGKRYKRQLRRLIKKFESDFKYFDRKFKSEIYRDIKLEEELNQVNEHVVNKIKMIEEIVYDTTESLSTGIEQIVTDSLSKTLEIIDSLIEDKFGDIDSRMDDIEALTDYDSNTYTIDDVFNSLKSKGEDHVIIDEKINGILKLIRDVRVDSSDLEGNIIAEFDGLIQHYLDETKDDIEQSVIMLLRELRDFIETEIKKLKK